MKYYLKIPDVKFSLVGNVEPLKSLRNGFVERIDLSFSETSQNNTVKISLDDMSKSYDIDMKEFMSEEYINKAVANFLLNDYFLDE